MPRKNKIIVRTGTSTPSAADFVTGEPAWDAANSKLYLKNNAGSMVDITGSGGGGATQVYEYTSEASFPATGSAATIYIATDSGKLFRWASTVYVEIGPLGGYDSLVSNLVPGTPTNVAGTAGNAQVTLTWSAPQYSASSITDYSIQYSLDGTNWASFSRSASTALSAVVTGLSNGSSYLFRVAAVSAIGTGGWSANSATISLPAADQYWSSVKLLLSLNGTNNSTTFTDSSTGALTITAVGSPIISTSQSKYGGASLYLNGSSYLSATASAIAIGTQDFTAEAWIRLDSGNSTYRHVFDTRPTDANGFALGVDGSNQVFLFSVNNFRVSAGSVSANTWYHLALCRASGSVRVFLGGTQVGSTWVDSTNYSETLLYIGKYYASGAYYWTGYLDDIRWTVGQARYVSTFTPPAATFPAY